MPIRNECPSLADFKVLTFDCYGTLIDWETGIPRGLEPLISRSGRTVPTDELLEMHARLEAMQQSTTPAMPYGRLLAVVYKRLAEGCVSLLLVKTVLRSRASSGLPGVPGVAIGASAVQHGAHRGRVSEDLRKAGSAHPGESGRGTGIMTIKNQDSEFRHPDTAAYLQSLTEEEAAKQPPLVRESGVRPPASEAEGGARRRRGSRSGAFETSIREELLGCGAKACAALLEALDAKLPAPCCGRCGRRKELHRRIAKTFHSRFGPLRVWRTYYVCRPCGGGHFPLDRALGLEGKNATPGAESIHADAASSDSCEAAVRKLGNLAGAEVSKATLRRRSMRIGEEMQAFEREDVEPEAPSASCILLGIDGTGIPMAPSEVEGVAGKQADGTAKTREAKTIVSARPAGIRRPGSFGGTRAAARPARASTARGRKAE